MRAFLQKSQLLLTYTVCIFALGFLISCDKDDPEEESEQEEITHVILTIKTGNDNQKVTWDHDTGRPDKTIHLTNGIASEVSIKIENRSDPNEVEDVTEEIREEADEHHIFIGFAGVNVQVVPSSSDPKDSAGNNLNLVTDWTPSAAGSGSVRIVLVHEPNSKTGTTRNDFGGEADFDINYQVSIK